MLTNSYAFLVGLLLAAGLTWRELRGRRRPWVVLFRVALAGWTAVVIGLTLFPLPVFQSSIVVMREGSEGPPYVNLMPFASVAAAVGGQAGPQQLSFVIGNLVAFAPLGILVPLVAPRLRYWWGVLGTGFLISLAIESTQWVGSLAYGFPWKSFDVDDLFLNSAGTLAGYLVYRSLLARDLEQLVA